MKITSVFVFGSFLGFSQVIDTIRVLPPIEIIRSDLRMTTIVYTPVQWLFRLNSRQIHDLNANDAGELIQRLPGVNMRCYGGLGGMKTISFRGLSNQDNAIVVDGFEVNNAQTGLANLAQLESDNITMIERSEAHNYYHLPPVSAILKGNTLNLITFNSEISQDSLQVRANVKYGSFGHKDVYLATKFKRNSRQISVFGKYRHALGNYPFTVQNGQSNYSGDRENNEYMDAYAGALYSRQFLLGGRLRMAYTYKVQDQQLPGAVILYNSSADEYMRSDDHSVTADYTSNYENNGRYRIYGSLNRNVMHYDDPNYLNNSGGLYSIYTNNSANAGFVNYKDLYSYKVKLMFGAESRYSNLSAEGVDFGNPERLVNQAVLGIDNSFGRIKGGAKLGVAHNLEVNKERAQNTQELAFLPSSMLSSMEIGRLRLKPSLNYQRSFRMPSFNELYYNNIGNSALNPEIADQFYLSLTAAPFRNKLGLYFMGSAFYNFVDNKIVAIPTKNLMVWAIQNIGKARVYGAEASVRANHALTSNWKSELSVGYTFLRSIDVTDVNSPTYGHQIAYTPVHTINADFSVSSKQVGISLIASYVSGRYALNENISANEVEGFLLLDAGAWYRFNVKGEQQFTLQLNVKNISNESYAYIRSFVMPGRNYLITLRYALH